jgi:hypothetical protein
MGQTLACCGKSEAEVGEIKTNKFYKDHGVSSKFLQLSQREQIRIVVRIQALFRGYLARKRVQQIKQSMGYRTNQGMMVNYPVDANIPLNYDNPDVMVLLCFCSSFRISESNWVISTMASNPPKQGV